MQREIYMREALSLARRAADEGEVPVGCVIVQGGEIVGRGWNRREQTHSALGHAEIMAIDAACRTLGRWRLDDCALFVTLEPCPMCAGAIVQARPSLVVYGAFDEQMGAMGSVYALHQDARIRGSVPAQGGVLRQECEALLREFFISHR